MGTTIFFSILEPRHLPLDTIQTHIPFLCTILLSPQTINSHDGPLDIKTTPPQQTATPPPASTNHKQHRQHPHLEHHHGWSRRLSIRWRQIPPSPHPPPRIPFKPPKLSFKTRIWHPNVTFDEHGSMRIGILKADAWKPSSKIMSVLTATQQLMMEPVPDDAVEQSAAQKFKEDRKTFDKEARDWTKKYAMGK